MATFNAAPMFTPPTGNGGGGGDCCDITSVTYNELVNLIGTSALNPLHWYLITDFTTTYCLGGTGITAPVEPLLVQARTPNSLFVQAYSGSYPKDIIHYSTQNIALVCVGIGAQTGTITYRKSTDTLLEAYYDWRSIQFLRWDTDGDNQYINYVATGGGSKSKSFFTFGNDIDIVSGTFEPCADGNGGNNKNISIGAYAGLADGSTNNIIFGSNCLNCTMQDGAYNSTIVNNSQGIGGICGNSKLLAKYTANANSEDDQLILLAGVPNLQITEIMLCNAQVNLDTATGGTFYSGPSASGVYIATASLRDVASTPILVTPSNFISTNIRRTTGAANGISFVITDSNTSIGQTLYFALATPQGGLGEAAVDIYVYGRYVTA